MPAPGDSQSRPPASNSDGLATPRPGADPLSFLAGGGQMGRKMREKDWAATPLGPPELWPQSLKTVIRIMLDSRYAMWMGWGPELTFFCNDAYLPTVGVKKDWVLGAPSRKVWAEIWPDIGPRIDGVLKSGQATWDEALLLFLERSGYPEETYHTFSYSPVYDDQGAVGGHLCVVMEVTERIVAERRSALLRELGATLTNAKTEQDVFAAVEKCLDGSRDVPFSLLYLFDSPESSPQLHAQTGIPAGSPILLPSHWPLSQIQDANLSQLLPAGNKELGGLPPGPWQAPPSRVFLAPIPQQGQSRAAGVFVAALNPHRPFDEAYQGFINLLVGQISSALASAHAFEEEKRRADALAELDRAKTTFFSNVSHEFRTPLTLMLGPLEDTISDANGPLPEKAAQELHVVHRNGLRLLKLVNALLDFSRIEAGRVQAAYEPTDLSAYTAELASVFRSATEKAGLTLTVNCPPLDQPVYVDRSMWEKIVLNLLSNAFKFTLQGSITVTLQRHGESAELVVADTGAGIPQDEIPRLFERFHRVEGTQGRTHEGTGIGLALVQELVRLHGGTVHVQSTLGQGSTFHVLLPLGRDHLAPERINSSPTLASTAVSAEAYVEEARRWMPDSAARDVQDVVSRSPEATPSPAGPRARIILADDNADMRDYVQRLLSTAFNVEAVADGQAALEAVQRHKPDLVLSDVMMPRLDGFGLLSRLRADPSLASIPVILLSARAGEESRIEGMEAGADDYLVKPFSARELLARVRVHIEMSRIRREASDREQALRQEAQAAKARVESILNSITDGFIALDRDWRFVYVNAQAERINGISREQLIGKNHWEVFPDTIGTIVHKEFMRAVRERIPVEFENYYKPFDRWFELNAYPTEDGGLTAYFRDITDRKRGDRFRAHLAAVVESSDDAIITKTLDGIITTWNTGAQRIFGYTAEEVIGKPVTILMPPDRVSEEPGILARLRRGERIDHYETVRQHKDGTLLDISLSVSPIRDSSGTIIGASKIARDITARKRIEKALRDSEARLRAVVEATPECVKIVAPDGSLRFMNRAGLGMVEADDFAAVKDACVIDLIAPEHRPQWREFHERVCAGEKVAWEFEIIGLHGARRWMESHAVPLPLSDGRTGQLAVTREITARKKAEAEREHLLQAERAARAEAERVSVLKDEFLATLSHELRTPLNAILGWAQLLRAREQSRQDLDEGLQVIERNTRVQVQLIEDLLDVSRITAGKVRLDVQKVDLQDPLKAAIASVRHSAEARDINIQVVIDPLAGPVRGDPARLQQCFWNLLSNSIKFTPKGGKVQVTLSRVNSHIEVCVTDTGQGIKPEFLPHLFERFRQADASTTRRHGGLGLGLSIVKHLVELHGGRVWARSQGLGQGATFCIDLPLMIIQPADESTPRRHPRGPASSSAAAVDQPDLKGLVVLAVDDEPDARTLIQRVLEECGAKVILASSASEGLQLVMRDRPSMIISDIGMPELDGYEFIRKVRSLPPERGGRTPAAALTAFARSEDRTRALRAGYQSHIAKPVEAPELTAVVASLAERR